MDYTYEKKALIMIHTNLDPTMVSDSKHLSYRIPKKESIITGRFFFPLKQVFPAVSPLSPMSPKRSKFPNYRNMV